MGSIQDDSEPNLLPRLRRASALHQLSKASTRLELGRAGEKAAADLLRRNGYEIVGSGFRARRGELDLICRRGPTLVVVEVKTRTDDAFGTPAGAVGLRKRRALMAAAAEYRLLAEWRGAIRYAVVGLTVSGEGEFEAELIEDPFT